MPDERDRIIREVESWLLRAGETPFLAATLAEAIADAAVMLSRIDAIGDTRTPLERARAWMRGGADREGRSWPRPAPNPAGSPGPSAGPRLPTRSAGR